MRAGLVSVRPTGGRRLNLLQWFGLGGAPLAWAVMHVAGWGVSELHCAQGRLGVDARTWQIGATAVAFAIWGLATAALAVNAVFFCMILLAGISTSVAMGCRGS